MQVYVVMGGYDYEGEQIESLGLFDSKDAADDYERYLKSAENYDYVLQRVQEINAKSILPLA